MKKEYNRLLIKGGILSPGELKMIIIALIDAGLKHLSFGSRQDILFSSAKDLHFAPDIVCTHQSQKEKENIICIYITADILQTSPWLTADRYLYILEEFKFVPALKINIADPMQRLVALFT